MKINLVQCKSVLTKSKLPEVDYCINPYIGCLHDCRYCYARFMRRFSGHADEKWGAFVDIKVNAPDILAKELAKKPKRGTVLLGSVTDAYQSLERKHRLTRQILAVLLRFDFPVSILTKSELVTRDVDLLKQFSDCEVGLTITSLDRQVSRDFEPRASLPKQRLEALQTLHDTGITTYAFIGPILPGLTDLESVISTLKGKVDFVMAESLNPRCGNWDELLAVIRSKYPKLWPLYQKGFNQGYWDKAEREVKKLCRKHSIPMKGFYRH